MEAVRWAMVGMECLAGALLLIVISMQYRGACKQVDEDRERGDWMVVFHERIWNQEHGHGNASPDRPEG